MTKSIKKFGESIPVEAQQTFHDLRIARNMLKSSDAKFFVKDSIVLEVIDSGKKETAATKGD